MFLTEALAILGFFLFVSSCFLLSIYVRRAEVENTYKVSRLVSVWVRLTLREYMYIRVFNTIQYRINSAATTLSWHVCPILSNTVNWFFFLWCHVNKQSYPSRLFQQLHLPIDENLGEQKGRTDAERHITQQLFSPRLACCQERLDTPRVRGHSSGFHKLQSWAHYMRVF